MSEKELQLEKNLLKSKESDSTQELDSDVETKDEKLLLYGVNDYIPLPTALLFGFQLIIVCASGIIAEPLIIADLLCARTNALARVKLVGTTMVACGIGTFIQCTFGLRLPLLQGPSFAFIPPILAMMNMPQYQCPVLNENGTYPDGISVNDVFVNRMQIVQGALLSAASFEMFLGLTGLIGLITRFVGPLTIAPLMLCLEFSIAKFCLEYTSKHWISIVAIALLILTALYLHLVHVPIPKYSKKDKCSFTRFPIFSVFPYLITISIVWILCIILTVTNVFDRENHLEARTDLRSFVISEAPWFQVPYPGQWGPISFNVGVFLGMIAATCASVTESIGDYYACARACNQRKPPTHANNRGILMEGFACFLCGLMGTGAGVTTYSENIGVIGITKIASRRPMQIAAIFFVIFGIFTKFGAVLATIPDPIVGAVLVVSCSMVGGVGLSTLQSVDLKLSRNLAILGCAIFMGVLVPSAVAQSPVNTGFITFDQLVNVLCSMQMFVGGAVGFLLDNTVPGATREQRGLAIYSCPTESSKEEKGDNIVDTYAFSPKMMIFLKKIPFSKHLPFLPCFTDKNQQSVHNLA